MAGILDSARNGSPFIIIGKKLGQLLGRLGVPGFKGLNLVNGVGTNWEDYLIGVPLPFPKGLPNQG